MTDKTTDTTTDTNISNNERHIKEIEETEDTYKITFAKFLEESDEYEEEDDGERPKELFEDDDYKKSYDLDTGTQYRDMVFELRQRDENTRRLGLAFSSIEPVERSFGNEILLHGKENVILDRLQNKAPLLLNHDINDQIGVVEGASVNGQTGRAVVRFGKSQRADEVYQDILEGIRSQVSVGYRIHEMQKASDDPVTFDVNRWEPFEVSIVSIGADQTVGVGRSTDSFKTRIFERNQMEPKVETEVRIEPKLVDMVDEKIIREEVQKSELNRISEIEAYGNEHNEKELARVFISEGRGVADFQSAILDKIKTRKPEKVHSVGLTQKENQNYSWMKLIRALANPSDRKLQEDASFEFEASRAQAEKNGIDPNGAWVPSDVIYGQRLEKRADLIVGTDSLGGYTVQTDVLSNNFIDVMRSNMVFGDVGVTELNGLNGKVSIPGISAGSTAYWVAENGAVTESNQTFIAKTMDGKTVGAMVDIGANLLKQSSMDIEAFVRNDIARTLAVEIENKGIVGDGSSNAPTGVNSTSGITMEALATADTPLQADIVAMWKGLASNNALRGNLNWVGASTALANMMATPRTATYGDIMILDPNASEWRLMGYPVYSSENCVFSGVNKLFLGDWSSLVMGTWGNGLQLNVDPYTNSNTGAVRVVGLYLVDFTVRNPKSFAATTNP